MMAAPYTGLTRDQVMIVANTMTSRPKPTLLHDYIKEVRDLVDGKDKIEVPDSHKNLKVGENHEGGLRLNARIRQGAAWLSKAEVLFSIAAASGDTDLRQKARVQERFARFGERKMARGRALHRWKQEFNRDLFECGVGILQQHPRAEYYNAVTPEKMKDGAKIEDVFWRRRVDPATWYWVEDDAGGIGVSLIKGSREQGELATRVGADQFKALAPFFDFAESMDQPDSQVSGTSIETEEIWFPDKGYLLISDTSKSKRNLKPDDPTRIVAEWPNRAGRVPFYVATVGTWPWHSPLDEMVQLTNERNYWATMLDLQAAGAIFRHWQLWDSNNQDMLPIPAGTPEHMLLDMSKPPPDMGPGTEWRLSPFEFHDVLPRYSQIMEAHESAGQSVARLMGQPINQNTAVGTADQLEGYARDEFIEWLESYEDCISELWVDTFRYIRDHHEDPVIVHGVQRDSESEPGHFFNTETRISGSDVVSEAVRVSLDTRTRISKIADYRLGREMQNNGDIDYERRVEAGMVPEVEDAEEEKAAIFISTMENMQLELQIMAEQQALAQSLGLTEQPPQEAPNITRGARSDPRGTGVEQGANNVANSGVSEGASDLVGRRRTG